MNQGKIFERAFAQSVPDYALLYRLPDPAQSFGGGNNIRFSRTNPFDFILFDSRARTLFAIETKTVAGKSISFERTKFERAEIHYSQIQGLNDWNVYDGVVGCFVIEFRGIEKTVLIDIDNFNKLIDKIEKKSFNFNDLAECGINYYVIPQTKKRTQFTYDVDAVLLAYSKEDKENNDE